MVKNSPEFSLLDLDLEAFWFHFSLLEKEWKLLEKEWKHFDFTLHFSKKSESIFFSLSTSRKRVKDFYFHFSLLELQKPTLAGPWYVSQSSSVLNQFWLARPRPEIFPAAFDAPYFLKRRCLQQIFAVWALLRVFQENNNQGVDRSVFRYIDTEETDSVFVYFSKSHTMRGSQLTIEGW